MIVLGAGARHLRRGAGPRLPAHHGVDPGPRVDGVGGRHRRLPQPSRCPVHRPDDARRGRRGLADRSSTPDDVARSCVVPGCRSRATGTAIVRRRPGSAGPTASSGGTRSACSRSPTAPERCGRGSARPPTSTTRSAGRPTSAIGPAGGGAGSAVARDVAVQGAGRPGAARSRAARRAGQRGSSASVAGSSAEDAVGRTMASLVPGARGPPWGRSLRPDPRHRGAGA